MRFKKIAIGIIVLLGVFATGVHCQESQGEGEPSPPGPAAVTGELTLTLVQATMCESIENLAPHNSSVVFSIDVRTVSCFTMFDPVPETAVIYQKWYKKDRLSTTQRLVLEPPRWRTYSSIHLREADKGPWRVEIVGPKGGVLKILRFSITD